MTYLERVLQDLDSLQIEYEEHYDPDGMQLFQLLLREKDNPILIFTPQNPNHVLISISSTQSFPNLENLETDDLMQLRDKLMELGSTLILKYDLRILNNNLFFITGIPLEAKATNAEIISRGILKLTQTYDRVLKEAIKIIQEF